MTPISTISEANTLDQLWHEAEQLGRVYVDKAWGNKCYEVKIRFQTRGGSDIDAKGVDEKIHFALAKALNEARDLGAGRQA